MRGRKCAAAIIASYLCAQETVEDLPAQGQRFDIEFKGAILLPSGRRYRCAAES